jgi:hypothetical protein
MPGQLSDYADGKGVTWVSTRQAVLDETLIALQKCHHLRVDAVEVLRRNGLVHRPPIHCAVGDFIADNELILGGSAGKLACPDYQRSIVCKQAFASLDRVLNELLSAEIAERAADIVNAKLRECVICGLTSGVLGVVGRHLLLS